MKFKRIIYVLFLFIFFPAIGQNINRVYLKTEYTDYCKENVYGCTVIAINPTKQNIEIHYKGYGYMKKYINGSKRCRKTIINKTIIIPANEKRIIGKTNSSCKNYHPGFPRTRKAKWKIKKQKIIN